MKIISWFSCGVASAVTSKLILDQHIADDVRLVRCVVANEHEDNDRFHADCERWYGRKIERIASEDFADCWEVWESRQYISGIKGAPCTVEMKKIPRYALEREWYPDKQAYGFTREERKRAMNFSAGNPDVSLLTPLIEHGLGKRDCKDLVLAAEIELPVMYRLGFSNNNCICCAKATSIIYWARCRHYFPAQFARMAELSRRIGCRLTRLKGKRIFLDEIPADIDWRKKDKENVECGLLCVGKA